jgi:predicted porin
MRHAARNPRNRTLSSAHQLIVLSLLATSSFTVFAQDPALTAALPPPATTQNPAPPIVGDLLNPAPASSATNLPTPSEKTAPAPDLLNPQPEQTSPTSASPQPATIFVELPPATEQANSPQELPPNTSEVESQSTPTQSQSLARAPLTSYSEESFPGLYNRNQAADLIRHSSLSKEEGFSFGINFSELYSSNLLLSSNNPQSSFRTQIGPSVTYRSYAATEKLLTLLASYSPSFSFYHGDSELNEISHSFDSKISYNGAKTKFSLDANYSNGQTTNRITQTLSETSTARITADARYAISPKTFINSNVSFSSTDLGADQSSSSDSLSFLLGASWQITPLTRMGPSIRYATSQSAFGIDRDSISYLGTLDYEFSKKTDFHATFGLEQVSSSRFGDQTNPTGTLSLNYRPTESWKINLFAGYESISTGNELNREFDTSNPLLDSTTNDSGNPLNMRASFNYAFASSWSAGVAYSLRQGSSPIFRDEDVTDFTQDYSLSYTFGVSSISAGYAISDTKYENISFNSPPRDDDNTNSIYISYTHPSIIRNLSSSINIRHTENTGNRDYKENAVTLSLGYRF